MAGKNLIFAGKILSVREATEEELGHGHAHGADGHSGH
jgi:FKBP-type peptidyl-prolyl cis-trans isomerase SlyD